MPPRLNLFSAGRVGQSLAVRSRPTVARQLPIVARIASQRSYADEKPKGPNQDNAPHVSEEAAQQAEIMGETKPDIGGQGTPVQEILKRDPEAKEQAPEVIKQDIEKPGRKAAKASETNDLDTFEKLIALGRLDAVALGGSPEDFEEPPGHKFGLPELPLPSSSNMHHRYDAVVDQVTNLIMQHGKKSVAQRNMAYILNYLRTSPPPTFSPGKPLLPGTPPAHHLPLNPVLYLRTAIDSIAPLLRIRSQKGAAGGGAALQIPVPLGLRQRRRTAIQWILDAVEKKQSRGSGKYMFAQRVAEELVSVVEGRSGAWDRRQLVHKNGTAARANLNYGNKGRRLN